MSYNIVKGTIYCMAYIKNIKFQQGASEHDFLAKKNIFLFLRTVVKCNFLFLITVCVGRLSHIWYIINYENVIKF